MFLGFVALRPLKVTPTTTPTFCVSVLHTSSLVLLFPKSLLTSAPPCLPTLPVPLSATVLTLSTLKPSPTPSLVVLTTSYATLGELQSAYNKLTLENVSLLDYILQGPGIANLDDSVAKANFLISIAEERKDCMASWSPPRYAVVGVSSSVATENTPLIIEWAKELTSSSYASIIDSGYKYTYDRYNDTYRYVPLNGDIGGLLVNTSINAQPWFSPAGLSRGQIRNVVKLALQPLEGSARRTLHRSCKPRCYFPWRRYYPVR